MAFTDTRWKWLLVTSMSYFGPCHGSVSSLLSTTALPLLGWVHLSGQSSPAVPLTYFGTRWPILVLMRYSLALLSFCPESQTWLSHILLIRFKELGWPYASVIYLNFCWYWNGSGKPQGCAKRSDLWPQFCYLSPAKLLKDLAGSVQPIYCYSFGCHGFRTSVREAKLAETRGSHWYCLLFYL